MEQSKIIDTLETYQASLSLIPTWHNFNVILLNCGMNIQIHKIQDKSSYCHRNNNTSGILTKQSCLLKITWPKRAIPTKSYSLAMLHLHHTKYLNHAQPR